MIETINTFKQDKKRCERSHLCKQGCGGQCNKTICFKLQYTSGEFAYRAKGKGFKRTSEDQETSHKEKVCDWGMLLSNFYYMNLVWL